jgi:hypothetical protein
MILQMIADIWVVVVVVVKIGVCVIAISVLLAILEGMGRDSKRN